MVGYYITPVSNNNMTS